MGAPSKLEERVLDEIRALGLPDPVLEYQFFPERKWRFDFAWPDIRVGIEAEGGSWGSSRHTSGVGFEKDCIKYNTASILGWIVARVTTTMMRDGSGQSDIEKAYEAGVMRLLEQEKTAPVGQAE